MQFNLSSLSLSSPLPLPLLYLSLFLSRYKAAVKIYGYCLSFQHGSHADNFINISNKISIVFMYIEDVCIYISTFSLSRSLGFRRIIHKSSINYIIHCLGRNSSLTEQVTNANKEL